MFGCDPCNRDSGDGRACLQCNAIFERQITLDEHILRTHPNSIASVTSKIHQCTRCAFKTTVSGCFKEHLSKHPETSSNKFSTCTHCDATFKRKSSLDNHLIKQHPNFISSVTNKIHKCTKCSYETTISSHLKSHLSKHSETPAICTFSKCLHCKASFRKKISLDDHILKNHPNFVSSVTSKVHKCTKCNFETTMCTHLKRHLMTHAETPDKHLLSTCAFCHAPFKSRTSLDDHILKKHPTFIASVTSKIHECGKCTFKTAFKNDLNRHSLKHLDVAPIYRFKTCIHCNVIFKRQITLDEHILRRHPNYISCVTSKIHECTLCAFKTTISGRFKKHLLLEHSETRSKYKLSTCTHCKLTFKRKHWLDNHVIRKHPNFIDSVTSKVHECTLCGFKTTISAYFKRHMLKHPETISYYNFSTCTHCDRSFRSKSLLDNHLIKKHPKFISSVTNKIHKCTVCSYETTISTNLRNHLLIHTKTSAICRPITCTHCKASFNKKISLDDHIIKYHPNFASSVTSKIHKCTKCNFETTMCTDLKRHSMKHAETPDKHMLSTCRFCQAMFKSKTSVDDHILRKHPTFIASVTSKIHECAKCTFKTVYTNNLKIHSLLKHSEPSSDYNFSTCMYCDLTFGNKSSLGNHLIKDHPNFIASITNEIHEFAERPLETTMNCYFKEHLFEQSETRSKYKLSTCTHCNLTFKRKHWLDNHVIRKHPNFIDSVTSKVHECILCGFKTTISAYFKRHMLKHPETSSNYRFSTCTHCDRTFKTKSLLDNHLIKKHPNFVSSVTNKIHKCTMCSYETTISTNLRSHLLIHAKTPAICRPITCPHCKASFNKKISLDDHIIKYHPSFASSVTSKVHKCTKCNFETTMCTDLKRHSMKHAETPDKHMLSTCRFCQATFKSKTSVDDHILRKHPNFIASKSRDGRACLQCNAIFKRQTTLDEHILRTHPNSISSVTSKLHECTQCAFKTTRHSLKHTETRPNHRPNTCALCHASFKTKRTLDNHTLQKHPKFIDSVTSKIHECTLCTFKTTMNAGFKEHLLKHPETISSYKFSACTHCDQTFKRKYLLDNHVLKKHPNVISSAINKIYKCTECNYETTISASLRRHMKVHSKTLPNLTCVQCNTTFKRKIFLDDHIVKKHPDFMESVTSRIHECRKCTFKTAFRNDLNRHSLNHLETAPSL
nr:unnamed protein product [Callosobruchus analis]